MSGRSLSPVTALLIALGVGAAVLGLAACSSSQNQDVVIDAPSGESSDSNSSQGDGETRQDSAPDDAVASMGSFDIDDSVIEAAITEGAANPLEGLPSRNAVATELLDAELAATGVDLTGMEIVVYPGGAVPSFVLLATSDSTPLLGIDGASDDEASELFLAALFDSAVLADFAVEKLIMQHSGTDEEGPFVMTIAVRLEDLQAANEGADVLDRIAMQLARP